MVVLAWWLVIFGMWPIADPGHSGLGPMVVADLLLHFVAFVYLAARFYLPRHGRLRDSTVGCVFGAHRGCDAGRWHGGRCSCPCHDRQWELLR